MFISFAKPSLLGLMLLCYGGCYCFQEVLSQCLALRVKTFNSEWLILELKYFGELFVGCLFFFLEFLMKNKITKENLRNENEKEHKHFFQDLGLINLKEDNQKKDVCGIIIFGFLLITLMSAAEMMSLFFLNITYEKKDLYDFTYLFVIFIFNFAASWNIVINLQLFSHHFISIAILFLGYLLVNLKLIVFGIETFHYLKVLIPLVLGILFSLGENRFKVMMIYKMITPKQILFFKGLIETLFVIGFLLIIKRFYDTNLLFIDIFNSGTNGVLCIGILILSMLLNIFFICILYISNSLCRVIACVNSNIFVWIYYQFINPADTMYIIIAVIGIIMEFVGALVYHEIIVLHFLGLDINIKKEIESSNEMIEQINKQNE